MNTIWAAIIKTKDQSIRVNFNQEKSMKATKRMLTISWNIEKQLQSQCNREISSTMAKLRYIDWTYIHPYMIEFFGLLLVAAE